MGKIKNAMCFILGIALALSLLITTVPLISIGFVIGFVFTFIRLGFDDGQSSVGKIIDFIASTKK